MSEDEKIQLEICKFELAEEYKEIEMKLAHLLIEGIIFCNNGWWYEKEGKPWQKDHITHAVLCNDLFYWGCADAEAITYSEIGQLYKMWQKDSWGPEAWCVAKRRQMPQAPIEKRIRAEKVWDLDKLVTGDMSF